MDNKTNKVKPLLSLAILILVADIIFGISTYKHLILNDFDKIHPEAAIAAQKIVENEYNVDLSDVSIKITGEIDNGSTLMQARKLLGWYWIEADEKYQNNKASWLHEYIHIAHWLLDQHGGSYEKEENLTEAETHKMILKYKL